MTPRAEFDARMNASPEVNSVLALLEEVYRQCVLNAALLPETSVVHYELRWTGERVSRAIDAIMCDIGVSE